MSNFRCEKCGAMCHDTPAGYISGCAHYPPDRRPTPEEAAMLKSVYGWLMKDAVRKYRIYDTIDGSEIY